MRNSILCLCALSLFLRQLPAARDASASLAPSCRSGVDDAALEIRRGGTAVEGDVDFEMRDVILRFLEPFPDGSGDEDNPFRIHGWRWHSMSLARDAGRLERLAERLMSEDVRGEDGGGDEGLSALERAADYVVNFNMAGLFRIESGMFADFLREHLCEEGSIGRHRPVGADVSAEADAFSNLVDKVDKFRLQSETIGRQLYEQAKAASYSSQSFQHRQQTLDEVSCLSRQLLEHLASMRTLQETLVVPAVSRVVPSKVQTSFNNRVLLHLGLLESRLHLVGMRDAIWESGIEDERRKFEAEIPYVARAMIERWRRSLYSPRAGSLDYGLEV